MSVSSPSPPPISPPPSSCPTARSSRFQAEGLLAGNYGVLFFYRWTSPSSARPSSSPSTEAAVHGMRRKVIAVSVDTPSPISPGAHRPARAASATCSSPWWRTSPSRSRATMACCSRIGLALRGPFLIDKEGIVRHRSSTTCRSAATSTRRSAWSTRYISRRDGEVCPAGWEKGDEGMTPTCEGVARYLGEHAEAL